MDKAGAAPDRAMATALADHFCRCACQLKAPAEGPTQKPKYLPEEASLKQAQAGTWTRSHSQKYSLKLSSIFLLTGMKTHLAGPRRRPDRRATSENTFSSGGRTSIEETTQPTSSAQALVIPRCSNPIVNYDQCVPLFLSICAILSAFVDGDNYEGYLKLNHYLSMVTIGND